MADIPQDLARQLAESHRLSQHYGGQKCGLCLALDALTAPQDPAEKSASTIWDIFVRNSGAMADPNGLIRIIRQDYAEREAAAKALSDEVEKWASSESSYFELNKTLRALYPEWDKER